MNKMFTIVLASALAVVCHVALSAPFVTPDMIRRNGLTDEQYEALWKLGKRPQIDIGAARQWMFKAGRYGNVTNWLDICGKTNNFAKLSYRLQDENFCLSDTNRVLVASNGVLRVEIAELEPDANATRKTVKAALKAAKKDSKNFEKWIKDTKKARDKSSEDMAEFYDSILEIVTGTVPNEEE